jgi:DNA polymerase-3 subunit delta'
MKESIKTKFKRQLTPLYHSYVIEGDVSRAGRELIDFLEEEHGVIAKGNPDVFHQSYGTFSIESARAVKEEAQRKKVSQGKKIFILEFGAMTREAGNALLKTLEEPFDDTHFFLITPSVSNILPTILSRCRSVKFSSDALSAATPTPADFISASKATRLLMVKKLLSELEKEKIAKADIVSFVENVLKELHQNETTAEKSEDIASLDPISRVASYSRDQSASLKMILEYLAISL